MSPNRRRGKTHDHDPATGGDHRRNRKVLGPAVFGLLVVYCFRNTDLFTPFALGGTHGIPELIGLLVTSVLFCWKRNMMVSMLAGTVAYMLLVQLVF